MYENNMQGVFSVLTDHWFLIAVLIGGYFLVARLGPAMVASLVSKLFAAVASWVAGKVGLTVPASVLNPSSIAAQPNGLEAALAATQIVVGHSVRTGNSDLLNASMATLQSLQKTVAKGAALLLVALLAGCSSATEEPTIQGPCGWVEPPTPEELAVYGEPPARTLRDVAPHLFDEDSPTK